MCKDNEHNYPTHKWDSDDVFIVAKWGDCLVESVFCKDCYEERYICYSSKHEQDLTDEVPYEIKRRLRQLLITD